MLATELKNLRLSAGLTHVDVAHRLGWQQGKVSKIEGAKQGVGIDAVIALAEVCHATGEQRDRLVELARGARAKGWWEAYADVLPAQRRTYVGLETDADSVSVFAAETLPDLLQTPDYAQAVIAARLGGGASEPGRAKRMLEFLLDRQRGLQGEHPELNVVITESALRREVGGDEVLREQLTYLADVTQRPEITLRVVPFAAGALPTEGPFTMLGFRRDPHPDVVFVSSRVGDMYFEDAASVDCYRSMLRDLEMLALDPGDSARFIADAASEVPA